MKATEIKLFRDSFTGEWYCTEKPVDITKYKSDVGLYEPRLYVGIDCVYINGSIYVKEGESKSEALIKLKERLLAELKCMSVKLEEAIANLKTTSIDGYFD